MVNKADRIVDMEDLLYSINHAAKNSEHGISGIAENVGQAEQTLRNKLNPNDDSHRLPLCDFVMVLKQTSDTTPIEVLCNMFGGRFMIKSQRCASSLMHAVLELMSEQGDLSKAIEEARADGKIDNAERARINREADEVIAAAIQIKNTVNKE